MRGSTRTPPHPPLEQSRGSKATGGRCVFAVSWSGGPVFLSDFLSSLLIYPSVRLCGEKQTELRSRLRQRPHLQHLNSLSGGSGENRATTRFGKMVRKWANSVTNTIKTSNSLGSFKKTHFCWSVVPMFPFCSSDQPNF